MGADLPSREVRGTLLTTRPEASAVAEFLPPGSADDLADAFGEDLDSVIRRVADYMAKAPVVMATDATAFRSDGRWFWTEAAAKAVRDKRTFIRVDFAEAVLAANGPPASLTREGHSQAMKAIMNVGRTDNPSS